MPKVDSSISLWSAGAPGPLDLDVIGAVFGGFYFASFCIGCVAIARERRNHPDAKLRRALRKAKKSTIRDAGSGGAAKVSGRIVAAGPPLTAPFSGRSCAYWSVTVKRYDLTLIHEERGFDFSLRDDTATAFVRLESATVTIENSARVESGPFAPTDPKARDFLSKDVRSISPSFTAFGVMMYREHVLSEGDVVAVSGPASWEPDPSPNSASPATYREAPQRLELYSHGGLKLAITDDPAALL